MGRYRTRVSKLVDIEQRSKELLVRENIVQERFIELDFRSKRLSLYKNKMQAKLDTAERAATSIKRRLVRITK